MEANEIYKDITRTMKRYSDTSNAKKSNFIIVYDDGSKSIRLIDDDIYTGEKDIIDEYNCNWTDCKKVLNKLRNLKSKLSLTCWSYITFKIELYL